MLGDVVHDDGDEAPLLLGLSAFTLFFMMLSHTGGRLYLPPSLLRLGFSALRQMASFTPLSNHLGSVVRILVLSSSTVCSGWSVCICFATSEVVELGLRCSLNLAFSDLSVSPTYVASHSSHLILYTGPTTEEGASSPSSRTTSPNIAGTTDWLKLAAAGESSQ